MRSAVIPACVALAVIPAASEAVGWKAPDAPLPIVRLLVMNRAHIRADLLKASEDDAKAIYRAAGVETSWVNVGPADMSDDNAVDFTVMIVAGKDSRLMAARTRDEALGFAIPASTMAFVLFDRVECNAATRHVSLGRLLGVVIAHEVGHLLLPANSHSEHGIMRAAWDLRSGLLEYFTAAQAAAIRQRLASRRRSSVP